MVGTEVLDTTDVGAKSASKTIQTTLTEATKVARTSLEVGSDTITGLLETLHTKASLLNRKYNITAEAEKAYIDSPEYKDAEKEIQELKYKIKIEAEKLNLETKNIKIIEEQQKKLNEALIHKTNSEKEASIKKLQNDSNYKENMDKLERIIELKNEKLECMKNLRQNENIAMEWRKNLNNEKEYNKFCKD